MTEYTLVEQPDPEPTPSRVDTETGGDSRTVAESDPCAKVTIYGCSECEGWSSSEAWQAAWWRERSTRIGVAARGEVDAYDVGWSEVEGEPPASTSKYGLDDRMVCPRCGHVHADDDNSAVDEDVRYLPAALLQQGTLDA